MERILRFLALLKKELIQLLKNPKTQITVFVPPVIQLFLLSYAATMDLKEVRLGVFDRAQSAWSRNLAAEFTGSPTFKLRPPIKSEQDMRRRIDERDIKLALVIPEEFSRELDRKRSPEVQIIVDGRSSFSAGVAAGYANDAIVRFNQKYFPESTSKVNIWIRGWYNPNYSAQYFMIPSLLAILTLLSLTLLVSLSFAREREAGTMDQLLLTPFSPLELLAGKGLASIFIGIAQLSFCMLFVRYWFHIPYASNYWLLYLLFLTFLITAVGIGLAVSVYCSTLQQAMIWTFLLVIPFVLLSGMATPISSMPTVLQHATLINPIRWSISALHRLFLEGATFTDILPTYLMLGAIGVSTFTFAGVSFIWQRRH